MEQYLKILKSHSLKVTPRRKAVLDIFLSEEKYLGPYDMRQRLLKKKINIGLPSVYRILQEFKEAGILVEVARADKQLYYGLCTMPDCDHHHFICKKCNKVEEVGFCNFDEIARFIAKKLKAKVLQHTLHIEGLCAACR
jgi:Fe2+ or Zn2+ uptake regulation protein